MSNFYVEAIDEGPLWFVHREAAFKELETRLEAFGCWTSHEFLANLIFDTWGNCTSFGLHDASFDREISDWLVGQITANHHEWPSNPDFKGFRPRQVVATALAVFLGGIDAWLKIRHRYDTPTELMLENAIEEEVTCYRGLYMLGLPCSRNRFPVELFSDQNFQNFLKLGKSICFDKSAFHISSADEGPSISPRNRPNPQELGKRWEACVGLAESLEKEQTLKHVLDQLTSVVQESVDAMLTEELPSSTHITWCNAFERIISHVNPRIREIRNRAVIERKQQNSRIGSTSGSQKPFPLSSCQDREESSGRGQWFVVHENLRLVQVEFRRALHRVATEKFVPWLRVLRRLPVANNDTPRPICALTDRGRILELLKDTRRTAHTARLPDAWLSRSLSYHLHDNEVVEQIYGYYLHWTRNRESVSQSPKSLDVEELDAMGPHKRDQNQEKNEAPDEKDLWESLLLRSSASDPTFVPSWFSKTKELYNGIEMEQLGKHSFNNGITTQKFFTFLMDEQWIDIDTAAQLNPRWRQRDNSRPDVAEILYRLNIMGKSVHKYSRVNQASVACHLSQLKNLSRKAFNPQLLHEGLSHSPRKYEDEPWFSFYPILVAFIHGKCLFRGYCRSYHELQEFLVNLATFAIKEAMPDHAFVSFTDFVDKDYDAVYLFGHLEKLARLVDLLQLERQTKVFWPDANRWNIYQPGQFRDWVCQNVDEYDRGKFSFDPDDEAGCSSWYGFDAETR